MSKSRITWVLTTFQKHSPESDLDICVKNSSEGISKMLPKKELRNTLKASCRSWHQIRTVVADHTSGDSGGPDSIKFKMYTDPDERRGYKFDGSLDLTALIDRRSSMGAINTSDADGFKARNFRTGGEPPDAEKAKEIMVFFKNRPKPPKQTNHTDIKSVLQSSKAAILGRAKEVASSFMNQRAKPLVSMGNDGEGQRVQSGRAGKTDNSAVDQAGSQLKGKTNSSNFGKPAGWKAPQSSSTQAPNPPQRGSYKMSKASKKQ